MTNYLQDFSDGIAEGTRLKEEERKAFNLALGEPDHFIPDEADPRFGIGYWRVRGGVLSYRRYANGYDPISRVQYEGHFISLLHLLMEKEPRS